METIEYSSSDEEDSYGYSQDSYYNETRFVESWLVKEVVGRKYTKNFSTNPLTLERVIRVYQNQRGGDS